MTLQEAETLFWFHAKRVGLPSDWTFAWKRRRLPFNSAGTCFTSKKEILLQPSFVELNTKEIVEQTILHELAHALTPRHGHNRFWKRKAIEIGHSGARHYSKEVNNGR